MATWRDRGLALRDRVLADPRFQRWAARFPLTRPIAERRATALFDLCAGFVYSQVLFACVHLGLLEALAEHGPSAPSELARTLQLSRGATERLLDAAADLALVERRSGNRWGLGKHGTSYVGNPGIAAMVRHHALLYRDLADPIALLPRGGRWTVSSPGGTSTGCTDERPSSVQTSAYLPCSVRTRSRSRGLAVEPADPSPPTHT